MSQMINIREQEYCFFGYGSNLKGEFQLKGTTHLACQLQGKVTMHEQFTLTVERNGFIDGEVVCHDLEIFGKVEGEIQSEGRVTIFPSAHVSANLQSKSLVIHPGAVVNMKGETTNFED